MVPGVGEMGSWRRSRAGETMKSSVGRRCVRGVEGLGEELSGSTAGEARRARSAVRTDRQWHWKGRWEGQGREERPELVSSRAGGQRGDG